LFAFVTTRLGNKNMLPLLNNLATKNIFGDENILPSPNNLAMEIYFYHPTIGDKNLAITKRLLPITFSLSFCFAHIWRWKLFSVTMCPQGKLVGKKNVTSKQMDMTDVSERMVM